MSANMELSEEVILFKENFEYINILELKLFKLSMLLSYNSNGNHAQLERDSKQVRRQLSDFRASTSLQKSFAMIRTNGKCTEAVILFREQFLNLKKSAINHCREKNLYIPQKELEKLKKDYRRIKIANEDYFTTILFTNMATIVWDQLVQKPNDDDELKVALCSFEIYHNKLDYFQDKINQLTIDINRINCNSPEHHQIERKIVLMIKKRDTVLNSFEARSCLRSIRRLTNGISKQAVDVRLVMMIKSVKKAICIQRNEMSKLACMTCIGVNKETLINGYNHSIVHYESRIIQYESMLSNTDGMKTERENLKDKIFNVVDTLFEDEVEMLDKVTYDRTIHKEECPVCLNERKEDGEKIVSMKCSVFHNLCTTCAIRVFTVDSRCPVCRAYV